jgi:hypothetical protein
VIALALRGVALTGVGALLMLPDTPEHLALWGVLVSSVVGLIRQVIDKRSERQERLDQRQERLDQRQFAKEDRDLTRDARADILSGIAHNTAITTDARDKADAAYGVANHVNEKIASIASAALTLDRSTALHDATDASNAITLDRATALRGADAASNALTLDRATALRGADAASAALTLDRATQVRQVEASRADTQSILNAIAHLAHLAAGDQK